MSGFFQPGRAERLKTGWHVALGLCAVGACGYNVAAWLARRERRLGTNALLYLILCVHEAKQIRRHARTLRAC